jgi:putative restriction endonuclease
LIGAIPGIAPGATFDNRKALAAAGVHRPLIAGICGTGVTGAESIVLNGGYVDDIDSWNEVTYTGHGGNDTTTKCQVSNQSWEAPGNAALVTSERIVAPVRVVRGYKGGTDYAPRAGYRYDGLYRVVRHWEETGKDGFRICRFTLVLADQSYEPPVLRG